MYYTDYRAKCRATRGLTIKKGIHAVNLKFYDLIHKYFLSWLPYRVPITNPNDLLYDLLYDFRVVKSSPSLTSLKFASSHNNIRV